MCTYPPTQYPVAAEAIVLTGNSKESISYISTRFDILTVSCIVNLMQFFVVYAAKKLYKLILKHAFALDTCPWTRNFNWISSSFTAVACFSVGIQPSRVLVKTILKFHDFVCSGYTCSMKSWKKHFAFGVRSSELSELLYGRNILISQTILITQ